MNKLISIVALVFCTLNAGGQSSNDIKIKKLDSLFNELNSNQMSMGSISIFKNGEPYYIKTYGIATIKDKVEIPSSENTMYRIGSVSKLFTAYLIMNLIEGDKLSLNETIETYFPTLKNAKTITIKQMLSHKSTLPIFHRVNDLEKLRKTKIENDLINVVNKYDENTDTLKTKYNNLNYILLGLIIEKKFGKPYNDVLITQLIEIGNPKIYGTYSLLDASKNEANSFHLENGKWKEDYENTSNFLTDGSGFLLADARTLNEFIIALFEGKLLSKASLESMLPKNKDKFGFGIIKSNFEQHKGYGHSGRIEGFTTALTYFPDDKISVAFVQNGTVYPLNEILLLVGKILFDEPFEMPTLKKIALTKEQEEPLIGIYTNEKEGYKVIVDKKKGLLRLRVAKGNGLLNKMILPVSALKENRLFSFSQGILFDFLIIANGTYSTCEMRVNGAKLVLNREE
jgi:CubicO group peptidase (beta-lactamase class C family)